MPAASLRVRITEAELENLKHKPRAVLGYVSGADWALMEFLAMGHAAWRYLVALPGADRFKLDLVAVVHPRWAAQVASVCQALSLEEGSPHSWSQQLDPGTSQCFALAYPPPPPEIWVNGYPFINNVHFWSDPRVAGPLVAHYGLAMKTDWDTFLSPMFLHAWPSSFMFGVQEYVVLASTASRLQRVAGELGLQHRGHHNLGPTWYGRAADLVALANASIPILHHILTQEFELLPDGSLKQAWHKGEGFPEWNAGMAAMYATELAANHLFDVVASTIRMDEHGDRELAVAAVWHIHCRHGDAQFSKFDFFRHHYDHVDVRLLDLGILRDYATFLAVSTWRQLQQLQSLQLQATGVAAEQPHHHHPGLAEAAHEALPRQQHRLQGAHGDL